MKPKAWLVMAGACVLLANSKAAAQVTFTRIVDTDTYAPGTGETFSNIVVGPLKGNTVVFQGETPSSGDGIYIVRSGLVDVILREGMVLPGIGEILGVNNPSFDGHGVAFNVDSYSGFRGILLSNGGGFDIVVQRGDPIPDSEHEFETLGCPSIDNGQIAFLGGAPYPAQNGFGIYFWDGDDLSTIVDQDTPVPGDGGAFRGFQEMQHANGDIAFKASYEAEDAEYRGVYSTLGGLHVVADTTMEMPGGTGPFVAFYAWPSFDGERVAFVGRDVNDYYAVFVATDDGLEFIADDAGWCLIDAGNVVYKTLGGDTCVKYGSIHCTIISPGDMLDGQEVLGVGYDEEGLDGTRLAFIVVFAEGWAMYVADFSGLCPGDLDFDADVDLSDLAIFLAHYGECSGDPDYWIFADIDRRGCVGLEDLATLLSNYGTSCD